MDEDTLFTNCKQRRLDQELLPNCTVDVSMPTSISVTAAALPQPITIHLFDHVRVSLQLRKSHAHRHMVYMTLIDLKHAATEHRYHQAPVRMSNKDMMVSIASQEQARTPLSAPSRQEIETMCELKKQQPQHSMYELLEQFRKMNIIETKS